MAGVSKVAPLAPMVTPRSVTDCRPVKRSVPPLITRFEAAVVAAPKPPAAPASETVETASTPPVMLTGPLKSLLVLIVSVPVPDFVSPVVPLR